MDLGPEGKLVRVGKSARAFLHEPGESSPQGGQFDSFKFPRKSSREILHYSYRKPTQVDG